MNLFIVKIEITANVNFVYKTQHNFQSKAFQLEVFLEPTQRNACICAKRWLSIKPVKSEDQDLLPDEIFEFSGEPVHKTLMLIVFFFQPWKTAGTACSQNCNIKLCYVRKRL